MTRLSIAVHPMPETPVTERPVPFFIIGFQRSGTTLLRLMLDSHPEVAIPLDTAGLWAAYQDRLEASYNDLSTVEDRLRLIEAIVGEERIRLWGVQVTAEQVVASLDGSDFAAVIAAFHKAYARTKGKVRWGSKDPGDTRRISVINEWFPDAQFVHIIRDGRDACLSQLGQDFGHSELIPCAVDWQEQISWVGKIGAILGSDRYLELRYEDLVADPEVVLNRVCEFLGLPFDSCMLEYYRRVGEAVPDEKRKIWPLIDRPPQKSNINRWKSRMSTGERICFEKRAWGALRDNGYEVYDPRPSGAYVTELRLMLRGVWRAIRHRVRV
jgi:Sulfotransferase family